MPIPIGDMPITDPFLAPILITNTIKLGSSAMTTVQDPTPVNLRDTALDLVQLAMIVGHWAVVKKERDNLIERYGSGPDSEDRGIAAADVLFIYIPIFSRMVVDGWLWNQDRNLQRGLIFANDVATLALLAARHGTSNSDAIHEGFCRRMPTDPRCSSA